MSEPTQQLAKTTDTPEAAAFALIQRKAALYANSSLVPAQYRSLKEIKEYGKVVGYEENKNALANCVIALNIANRMQADELMIMQNLYVVEGRPSWSSQWVISAVNTCGKFSAIRFEMTDLGQKEVEYSVTEWENGKKQVRKLKQKIQNLQCVAWVAEKSTGERLEGPPVSMELAVQEGWYGKSGSKWQTMPQMMIRYRAASFFGKLYAPELLMGLPTSEEIHDMPPEERVVTGREVPTAKVPEVPAMFALTEKAPDRDFVSDFWRACDSAGMESHLVMAILREQMISDAEYPADISQSEAESALAVFDSIKAIYAKGGAA